MNSVPLHLHRLRLRLGFAGLAGLAVATGGLVGYLFAVLPAERQAQFRAEQLLLSRSQPDTSPVAQPARAGGDAALAEFYGQFPVMRDLPERLKTLHALARKHEIALDRADFKLSRAEGEKLLRYEITLPARSRYRDLRSFIEEAAHRLPTMGLNNLTLKREAVEDSMVQARLNFILYLSAN